jgi:uncharacterized protein (TIGR03437 family)
MLCCAAAEAFGQPGISQNGVVNLASRIPPTLAGGAIARGALFSIYGVRLGSVDHTTVTITQGAFSARIQIVNIFQRRIEALMPRSAPLGTVSLVVTADGKASREFPVDVAASNPGIFSRNGEGWGAGRIENIAASGKRSANATSNPARPGTRVSVTTTGLGNATRIALMVGGLPAKAEAPRPTAKPGEEQFTFRIPGDAPEGCYVPLYLLVSDTRASNVVTMAIRSRPGPCDPSPLPITSQDRFGAVVLSRTSMRSIREGAPELIADDARIVFITNPDRAAPSIQLPPPGTCVAYTGSYQANTNLWSSVRSIVSVDGQGMDAGAKLVLSRANQTRTISQPVEVRGYYRDRIGTRGDDPRRRALPLFLEPGELTVRGTGGKEVGPFTTPFSVPAPFEWVDREQTPVVERNRGVTVHWKGSTSEQTMVILARNIDQITTAFGTCVCTASSAAGRFSIPAALLANIPATQDVAGVPLEALVVVALTLGPGIKASGLNGGFGVNLYAVGRPVEYR